MKCLILLIVKKLLAKLITYAFFPGTMGLLGFVMLTPAEGSFWMHGLFLIVFPLLVLFILLKLNRISDVSIYNRGERFIPLLLTTLLAVLDFLLVQETGHIRAWQYVYISGSVIASLTTLLLLKISLHGIGVGSFFGLSLFCYLRNDLTLEPLCISLVIMIAVYWSRRALQAHSHKELIAGVSTGFLITFVMYFLYGL